ncbi:MAG: hypothetical protein QM711_12845 [Micropruina sp.]
MGAGAKHRDAVGQRLDLVKAMGNEQDAATLIAQLADDGKHLLDGGGAERRSGFVENEKAGLLVERLGDLDQLTFGERQFMNGLVERDRVRADAGERLPRAVIGAAAHQAETGFGPGQHDIVADAEARHQR